MRARTLTDSAAWRAARLKLLADEKALTREADRLAAARRALPRLRISKSYRFTGPQGGLTLADLFGPRSQLVTYHFMFPDAWEEGCTSCSFWADNMEGIAPHMAARDTALVMTSAAPYPRLAAYRERMGWTTPWVSEADGDFGSDMGARFTPDQLAGGGTPYNFGTSGFPVTEAPGLSVFLRDPDGAIFLTYQAFARGLEAINAAYGMIDLTPRGRDEGDGPMAWLRRRDSYPGPGPA